MDCAVICGCHAMQHQLRLQFEYDVSVVKRDGDLPLLVKVDKVGAGQRTGRVLEEVREAEVGHLCARWWC